VAGLPGGETQPIPPPSSSCVTAWTHFDPFDVIPWQTLHYLETNRGRISPIWYALVRGGDRKLSLRQVKDLDSLKRKMKTAPSADCLDRKYSRGSISLPSFADPDPDASTGKGDSGPYDLPSLLEAVPGRRMSWLRVSCT
jgi:hypothetical protein